MESKNFAGPVSELGPLLIVGNFMSEEGVVVDSLGVSYGCFKEPPSVGELIVVRVWRDKDGTFNQSARRVTPEEQSELEGLDGHSLGGWIRSREV